MKSLQIVTPHRKCIFNCPFCISKSHSHKNFFENTYEKDFNKWKNNLEELKVDAEVVIGDATMYTDIDDYSIFFLYNPFGETAIAKVLKNIIKSIQRKNREVYIVYGNPFFHKELMNYENIELFKQIDVNLYDPILNIYRVNI